MGLFRKLFSSAPARPAPPDIEVLTHLREVRGLEDALEHDDPSIVLKAAAVLGHVGDETTIRPLWRARKPWYFTYHKEFNQVIDASLVGIAKRAKEPALKALLDVLKYEIHIEQSKRSVTGNFAISVSATAVIAAVGEPAIDFLLPVFREALTARDMDLCGNLVVVFGNAKNDKATGAVRGFLKEYDSPNGRGLAIGALAAIGGSDVTEEFLRIIKRYTYPHTSIKAGESVDLGQIFDHLGATGDARCLEAIRAYADGLAGIPPGGIDRVREKAIDALRNIEARGGVVTGTS